MLLQGTRLAYQELEKKFNKDQITNFPQNANDIKNYIISLNLNLKITLSNKRKKNWRKFKRKPRKSIKESYYVEVALERSQYVNVTKGLEKGLVKTRGKKLRTTNLRTFWEIKKLEQRNSIILTLFFRIKQTEKKTVVNQKFQLTKLPGLISEITRSNLIDQKRQKELSCDLIENGTLCNTSR